MEIWEFCVFYSLFFCLDHFIFPVNLSSEKLRLFGLLIYIFRTFFSCILYCFCIRDGKLRVRRMGEMRKEGIKVSIFCLNFSRGKLAHISLTALSRENISQRLYTFSDCFLEIGFCFWCFTSTVAAVKGGWRTTKSPQTDRSIRYGCKSNDFFVINFKWRKHT